jgi:hypothetical protein
LYYRGFFTLVGLGLMITGTVLGSTRLFAICRFPLKANIPRLTVSSGLTLTGSMMYIGINSDQHTWTSVGLRMRDLVGATSARIRSKCCPTDQALQMEATKSDDEEHRKGEIRNHSEDSNVGGSDGPYARRACRVSAHKFV